MISRLFDGRVIKLSHDGVFVLTDGKWVLDPDILLGAITESKPLTEEEIAALTPSGTTGQEEDLPSGRSPRSAGSAAIRGHGMGMNPRELRDLTTLDRAILLAVQAHQGQEDKAGRPYILHPLRVMLQMQSESEMMAAVLHDAVEDGGLTPDRLRREGFPDDVVAAVACLTKRSGEPYEDYIGRIKANPLARRVKLSDLHDNMDTSRLSRVEQKDLDRLAKYRKACETLTSG